MKEINRALLNTLIQEADNSPRKRKNYNFHQQAEDPIQRMLNALSMGTYIQPHRHKDPDKREVFIILTGKAATFTFDDYGNITKHTILDATKGSYGVEIPVGVWHTIIALDNHCVVYEVKDGPYSPLDDKNFANWAPPENSPKEECDRFIEMLRNELSK